jgi:hypothetical protein
VSKTLNSPKLPEKKEIIEDGFDALRLTMQEFGIYDPISISFQQDDGTYITVVTQDWEQIH